MLDGSSLEQWGKAMTPPKSVLHNVTSLSFDVARIKFGSNDIRNLRYSSIVEARRFSLRDLLFPSKNTLYHAMVTNQHILDRRLLIADSLDVPSLNTYDTPKVGTALVVGMSLLPSLIRATSEDNEAPPRSRPATRCMA